jgi:hypothetical protein
MLTTERTFDILRSPSRLLPHQFEDRVHMETARNIEELIRLADALHGRISLTQRQLFGVIAEMDRTEAWRDSGAHDMAHWLSMRYGISYWKAERWIASAHALESLPRISEAFSCGELGLDKVVELTRLASPETEGELLGWAEGVAAGAIRRRAELERRREAQEAKSSEESRYLKWWYFDEGRRFALEGELPAADGARVAKALDKVAETVPTMPGEEDRTWTLEQRRADALVATCSGPASFEAEPDRATVVVHTSLEALTEGDRGAEIDGGPVIHAEVARRLACHGRLQVVVEDEGGDVHHVGRARREPPSWMMRQLRYRDFGCRFPGCGSRRWLQGHHIRWWTKGGETELSNLVLVCFFHHKVVHEYGWSLSRARDGTVEWFMADGNRYRAGPAPPDDVIEGRSLLSAAAF